MTAAISPSEEHRIERWFLDNGVPQLVADYDPREDTLTRLQPVLVVLFLLALALVLRPDWEWWQRGLAVLVGAGLALAGLVVANVLRRRRPLGRPERVGFAEAVVVVLTPAVASLVLGDDPARSRSTRSRASASWPRCSARGGRRSRASSRPSRWPSGRCRRCWPCCCSSR